MKSIRLAVALLIGLLPCIAFGDPTAPLTITITTGAGVPVPAGAVAAGFNTLALNSDFTQQFPPNWLGGCAVAGNGGAWDSNDATGHTWYLNLWWMWSYNSCYTVQKPDPAFGGLVLDIPWIVDSTNFHYGSGGAIETVSSIYNPATGAGETHDFPNNAYYEVVLRMSPVAPSSFGAFVTWPSAAVPDQNHAGLEYDVIELDAGNLGGSDAAFHNWHAGGNGQFVWCGTTGCLGSPGGLPGGFNANNYHKFGLRTTSDGTTAWICSYIDDVLTTPCIQVYNWDPSWNATQRYFVNLQSFCDSWNYPSGSPCNGRDGQEQHMYVKTVRVWSCSNWATQQCNRVPLTGPP